MKLGPMKMHLAIERPVKTGRVKRGKPKKKDPANCRQPAGTITMCCHRDNWLLAVDVGNSAVKFGLYAADPSGQAPSAVYWTVPTWTGREVDTATALSSRRAWGPVLDQQVGSRLPNERLAWTVVSVSAAMERSLAEWVGERRPEDTYRRLENVDFPLEVCVSEPGRVGGDRLAAAAAAQRMRTAKQAMIIVDAGTAITVDALDEHGRFLGGAIIPGPLTTARALALGTAALPELADIDLRDLPTPIGTDTQRALQSGLAWGCLGAVREVVKQIDRQLGAEQRAVICTGGFGRELLDVLPSPVHYEAHLVLSGIRVVAEQCGNRMDESSREPIDD